MKNHRSLLLAVTLLLPGRQIGAQSSGQPPPFHPTIPKAWDDAL